MRPAQMDKLFRDLYWDHSGPRSWNSGQEQDSSGPLNLKPRKPLGGLRNSDSQHTGYLRRSKADF